MRHCRILCHLHSILVSDIVHGTNFEKCGINVISRVVLYPPVPGKLRTPGKNPNPLKAFEFEK